MFSIRQNSFHNLNKIVILLLCLYNVSSFYGSNSEVKVLNQNNFNKEVVNSENIWMVEFYAPWCGHCKNLTPEWEKAAKALKGIVKVGAVDADAEKSFGSTYGIQGFPTIKFFGLNKGKPLDYQGERTADAIVKFVLDKVRDIANYRLSGKDSGKASGKASSGNSEKKGNTAATDKDVIVLEDGNFDELLMKSKDMWMVEFYAPWCGHCKKLEPEWNQVATELKGKIKIAKVDATVQQKLGSRFAVKGYPTIKIFAPGQKTQSSVESYDGPREASAIIQIALEKLEKYGIIPDVDQLTNESQFKDYCKERNGVCVIALLPNIIDSSAKQRNSYIEEIKEATKSVRGKPFYYLWAQGADFFDMEEKLHMTAGYPAVVAINFNKKKYSVLRGAFGSDNLKSFVNNLLVGKEPLMNLPELTKLKSVKEWDGKDAKVEEPVNDEF